MQKGSETAIRIRFVEAGGAEHIVDASKSETVMSAAIENGVPGVVAQCGGNLSCATCHCYVDESWRDRLPPPGEYELEMLEGAAAERMPNSRLTCQIKITPELDGATFYIPKEQ